MMWIPQAWIEARIRESRPTKAAAKRNVPQHDHLYILASVFG